MVPIKLIEEAKNECIITRPQNVMTADTDGGSGLS